jgi:chromosome segregation ATPase
LSLKKTLSLGVASSDRLSGVLAAGTARARAASEAGGEQEHQAVVARCAALEEEVAVLREELAGAGRRFLDSRVVEEEGAAREAARERETQVLERQVRDGETTIEGYIAAIEGYTEQKQALLEREAAGHTEVVTLREKVKTCSFSSLLWSLELSDTTIYGP